MSNEFNANFDKPTPKYVLCPGFVISLTDGERHYLSAKDLAHLYHVSMSECIVQPDLDDPRNKYWHPPEDSIELKPRHSGDYTLPHNDGINARCQQRLLILAKLSGVALDDGL